MPWFWMLNPWFAALLDGRADGGTRRGQALGKVWVLYLWTARFGCSCRGSEGFVRILREDLSSDFYESWML